MSERDRWTEGRLGNGSSCFGSGVPSSNFAEPQYRTGFTVSPVTSTVGELASSFAPPIAFISKREG